MRWIALALGLFLGFQAWQGADSFAALFSAFFLYQAVTNTGCWSSSGCSVPQQNSQADSDVNTITYKEINE